MTTASERIADFVTGFDLDKAPDGIVRLAENAFTDTAGVILAGSGEPAAVIAQDMVAAEGATPAATVIGTKLRTSPLNAALANGTATQALDYDLTFMSGQAAASVIPSLLPMAETLDAPPREMIAAFVVGCEVCARLVRSHPNFSSKGWHGAGVIGAITGAAALARLAKAKREHIPSIIGLAASMSSGLGVNFGTMTKPLHAALAARSGVTAVQLGMRGFTASAASIEGKHGYFAAFTQGRDWDGAAFDDLGTTYNLLDPGYKIKPYACGGLMHTSIEAALGLRQEAQPRLASISRITIGVTPYAKDRAIDTNPWSEDSARFSLPYLIATSILHGPPMSKAFTEAAIDDDKVRALAALCEIVEDEEIAKLPRGIASPGRVTIAFKEGQPLSKAVYDPSGSPANPMDQKTIEAKFMDCATRTIARDKAAQLYACLQTLSKQETSRGLWPLLVL